jgi:hypothetical protein
MNRPYSGETSPKLHFVAKLTEKLVPDYDIRESDPIKAAESGTGNCLAKSVISAVMLERAKLLGASPAIAWNTNTHPKYGNDMFGAPRILNGHAYLLTSSTKKPYVITGISFNPDSVISSNYEIFNFNNPDQYAEVKDSHEIVATEAGKIVGYVIAGWHESSKMYMEALGSPDSVFHRTNAEEMTHLIMTSLVQRDVISTFNSLN